MLFRFCLYGFLKNQRYYDPFLILFFRQEGLSFSVIGLLVGFRELLINIFEVPSGALADLCGRRRCMIFSFCAYIASFAVFAFSSEMWHFFAAMALFALGEAFRTGTHKAMIFGYLVREGRSDEKTRYYGTTRSFSKLGSAVSVVIASAMVFGAAGLQADTDLDVYRYLFLASIVPYVIGLINFAGYPDHLDGLNRQAVSARQVIGHLCSVGRQTLKASRMRRLMIESMGFEGTYKVAKDYLQPVIKVAALSLPCFVGLGDIQRTAGLILVVYVVLHIIESLASRRSDTVRRRTGGDERGARFLWWANLFVFAAIAAGLGLDFRPGETVAGLGLVVTIVGFLTLAALQNLWRPIQVGRFSDAGDPANGATVLSIESQVKSLSAAILAPLLGLAVDWFGAFDHPDGKGVSFIPVALTGLGITAAVLIFRRQAVRRNNSSQALDGNL
ncbi:MAG: MFS transporter [Phycisphaerae bacterium]|nr:MFS transporter [Phycisphaerae bacterium]